MHRGQRHTIKVFEGYVKDCLPKDEYRFEVKWERSVPPLSPASRSGLQALPTGPG